MDTVADREPITRVRAALAAGGDPQRAVAQQRYMKSAMPFYGLGLPAVRSTLRPILREHPPATREVWEATTRALWDEATHREERYAAIELTGIAAARPWQDPAALALYEHLVRTGSWWDYVDPIASGRVGLILRGHRAATTPVIRSWAVGDDLWVRRTAILCQLQAGADTDLDLLTAAIDANTLGTAFGSEFFIRKAIGWALRQHARTDPDWVRSFVAARSARLAPLSMREALKHL